MLADEQRPSGATAADAGHGRGLLLKDSVGGEKRSVVTLRVGGWDRKKWAAPKRRGPTE